MNIGGVGGGSVGLLLSSYLSINHQTTLYVRRDKQRNDLLSYGVTRDQQMKLVDVLMYTDMKKEDLIIVCVKQPDVKQLIPYILNENRHTPILFLQNGMGHLDIIKQLKQPVLIGVVEHGAYRVNDFTVSHTGNGVIKLALLKGEKSMLHKIYDELHTEEFPFDIYHHWEKILTEKLIVNAVINPLTALFNVKNGHILTNRFMNYIAHQLCIETAHVLGLNPDEEWERVQYIAQTTSENISSMLKDIRAKRPTEIDAISGYVLNQKNSYQKPYTTFVYHSIKALEIRGD